MFSAPRWFITGKIDATPRLVPVPPRRGKRRWDAREGRVIDEIRIQTDPSRFR
jgi:hypothetical protein